MVVGDSDVIAQWNANITAWFWVNGTENLSMSISDEEFPFDTQTDVTVTVTGGDAGTNSKAMVRIVNETDELIHDWSENQRTDIAGGDVTAEANSTSFTHAGFYNVSAYYDLDGANEAGDQVFYVEDQLSQYFRYYNDTYGSPFYASNFESQATDYNYSLCGPWDPPELTNTSSNNQIEVTTAEPTIVLTNTTQYYGHEGRLDINVTDGSSEEILGLSVWIDDADEDRVLNLPATVTHLGGDAAANSWTTEDWDNGTGTWTVWVTGNKNGDDREEWNGSAEFEVNAAPGLLIKIVDDGDGDTDMVVEGGPVAIGSNGVVDITFQVVNGSLAFYGANNTNDDENNPGNAADMDKRKERAMKNITISGDACLLGSSGKTLWELRQIGGGIVEYSNAGAGEQNYKNYTVHLIPIMDTYTNGGGQITISATWNGSTADPQTIQFGGDENNGTLVSISDAEITIDQNISLTVTVSSPNNPNYYWNNAEVRLYFINDSGYLQHQINRSIQSDAGNWVGEYTFWFNRTQQTDNQTSVGGWTTYKANRYIAAYVDAGNSNYGYACARLVGQRDMKVTWQARDTGSSSGMSTIMAGRDYDRMYFNVSLVDSDGNLTGYPQTGTGQSILDVRIYNADGDDVTDNISASFTNADLHVTSTSADAKNITLTGNNYVVKPGVYTVFAYNNTHDSTGNNATMEVVAAVVEFSIESVIWNYDDNISIMFTVTYQGDLQNGTLRIDNISDKGDYNLTYVNSSFNHLTGLDTGGHTSLTLTRAKGFENGVVYIHNITANNLTAGKAIENITFYLKAKKSNSQYARCVGRLPVKIPDVDPTPETIPYNKAAEVEVEVTGRGTGLNGVFVSLIIPGLPGEMNTTTSGGGMATFAFTPPTTGTVVIKIENRTADNNIKVTSWALYLITPSSANEADTFEVTVRNKTINGDAIEGATITFDGETYTTDSDGKATINSPTGIAVDSEFEVMATKEGYAQDSNMITIIDKPQLEITIDQTPNDDGAYSSPVDVYVSDEDGNLITAATVTFDTQVLTTVNGKVTITVSEKTVGEIGATKTGFSPAIPVSVTIQPAGIPGFELLTLIAAIGVAFILLRRRRH